MIEIQKGFYIQKSTRKNKKYDVYTQQNGKYNYLLSFGDKRYQHFKDGTPIKAYTQMDHNDINRRKRFFARQGTTKNRLSPNYWSGRYLW